MTLKAGSVQSPVVELTYSMFDEQTKITGKHPLKKIIIKTLNIKLPKVITLSFTSDIFPQLFSFFQVGKVCSKLKYTSFEYLFLLLKSTNC